MNTNKFYIALALALGISTISYACTGISLKSKNNNTIVARTIEWAASDMNPYCVLVPAGYISTQLGCEVKYSYTGLASYDPQYVLEGLNEKGLSAGLFYFPGCGKYPDPCDTSGLYKLYDVHLVSYVLATCSTLEEVKATISGLLIQSMDQSAPTVHWRFIQQDGKQIVFEIIDGKYVFYDNPVGVLTNSPSFDYHLTNLHNYVNLTTGRSADNDLGNLHLRSFSAGTALHGLPGDFSSPSRFVRASFASNTAPILETNFETVCQAFHIMNLFDIPVGMQIGQAESMIDIPSSTQFTVATDLQGLKLYYRTMYNSRIRCVDLSRINPKKSRYTVLPLDKDRVESVEMLF